MAQPQGLTLIAGRYTITFNSIAIGVLQSDGSSDPRIDLIPHSQPIKGTDGWGDGTIDHISRGSDAFLSLVCMEYKAGSYGAAWPWGAAVGYFLPAGYTMGNTHAKALVMTAIAGPTAATAPATITATYALPTPETTIALMYGPTLRKIPIQFQFLPYSSSGSDVHFTQT